MDLPIRGLELFVIDKPITYPIFLARKRRPRGAAWESDESDDGGDGEDFHPADRGAKRETRPKKPQKVSFESSDDDSGGELFQLDNQPGRSCFLLTGTITSLSTA